MVGPLLAGEHRDGFHDAHAVGAGVVAVGVEDERVEVDGGHGVVSLVVVVVLTMRVTARPMGGSSGWWSARQPQWSHQAQAVRVMPSGFCVGWIAEPCADRSYITDCRCGRRGRHRSDASGLAACRCKSAIRATSDSIITASSSSGAVNAWMASDALWSLSRSRQ